MISLRTSLLIALCGAVGLPLFAGEPIPDIDVILEQNPGGLIAVLPADSEADEIFFSLPSKWVARAELLEVPEGWMVEVGTHRKETIVRLVSCSAMAAQKDQGEQQVKGIKDTMRTQVRDVTRSGWCTEGARTSQAEPKRPAHRMKMTFGKRFGNILKGVAMESYSGGKPLSQTADYQPPVLDPVAAAGSLSGLVELPPTVSPGETVQADVLDPERLPPGGQWSLSGVVLDEVPKQTETKKGSVTVSNALKSSHDVAMKTIRNLRRFAVKEEGVQEADDGPPRVTIEEEEVSVFELETPAELADRGLTLFAMAAGKTSPCGRPAQLKKMQMTDAVGGEALAAATVQSCLDPAEPPQELPEDAGLVAVGAVGAELTAAMLEEVAYLLAVRQASGSSACGPLSYESSPAENAPRARRTEDGGLELTLPSNLATDRPLSLSYEDKWGRQLLDVPEVEGVDVVEPLPEDSSPRIIEGSPYAFPDRRACVCGSFPTEVSRSGLLLGGAPAEITSASSRAVRILLPADLPPGETLVRGMSEAGFGEADQCTISVLGMRGMIDQEQLFSGGSTTMRLQILGTDQPLDLRLTNRTPSVIRLEGGDEQVATSSGGEENIIVRTVSALSRGAFDIAWALDQAPCPCVGE